MSHFMFYAGKAYKYKLEGHSNPVLAAVCDGERQEIIDPVRSKYSYEDLPTDYYAAFFGAHVYDPNSNESFAEQLANYLEFLGATNPESAPNWGNVPEADKHDSPPSTTNKTVNPMFVKSNNEAEK